MPLNMHSSSNTSKAEKHEPYVFLPNLNEVIGGRLRLRYSTANNTYYRDYDDTLDPKTTNVKPDWESVLYNFRGMKRYRDDIHDELYLDRDGSNKDSYMVWKFDFSSSGLVVDTVQAKVEAIRAPNGHVLMSIRNEQDEENEQELEEDITSLKTINFAGSSILTIKLTLSAHGPGNCTKLFLQPTAGKKIDCPLDINIRLKRPGFALGRSLVLLGLMYSNERQSDIQRKIKQKKQQGESNKKGYLYVHLHQAKRLPMRNVGMTPDPQVKCKLTIDDKGPSCKTARIRKTVNPTWDEQYIFEGVTEERLASAKLQVQITHDVRAFNRCKKREILGTVNIQQLPWFDSGSDEDDSDSISPKSGPKKKPLSRDCNDITCSRLSGSDRNIQKLTYDEDIIDIMLNGSSPDLSSNPFTDESNENKLNNKHRSVSLTSLQSTATGSIKDIHISGEESWWQQARRKSLGRILNIGTNKVDKGQSPLKRPSIVLSNSQESVLVFDCDEKAPTDQASDAEKQEISYPNSSFLSCDLFSDSRRTTLTPFADSAIDTLVEPLTQIQDMTRLAATHWKQLSSYKERWLYCWHPLTLIETL